ncbi:hypothetical protein IQ06DRAFT_103412 [Phaeosphaeriaceae sp. SRC1lsM3a]|nr:hypothetical protein IQ06DRAFT_103412 [Stagonospora sp. SRC1lsM3a]
MSFLACAILFPRSALLSSQQMLQHRPPSPFPCNPRCWNRCVHSIKIQDFYNQAHHRVVLFPLSSSAVPGPLSDCGMRAKGGRYIERRFWVIISAD